MISRAKQIGTLAAGAALAVGGFAVAAHAAGDVAPGASHRHGSAAAPGNDPESGIWISTGPGGRPKVMPRQIQVEKYDSVRTLKDLSWSGWGKAHARASGLMVADSRTGTGEGRLVTYRVTIVASNIKQGEASGRYTRLRVTPTRPGHSSEVIILE